MNRQEKVKRHCELIDEINLSASALEALRRHLGCSVVDDVWIQHQIEKWEERHYRAYGELLELNVWGTF